MLERLHRLYNLKKLSLTGWAHLDNKEQAVDNVRFALMHIAKLENFTIGSCDEMSIDQWENIAGILSDKSLKAIHFQDDCFENDAVEEGREKRNAIMRILAGEDPQLEVQFSEFEGRTFVRKPGYPWERTIL